MARSSYIYIALDDALPVAAFTVKWELERWLSRQEDARFLDVFRMKDGEASEPIRVKYENPDCG